MFVQPSAGCMNLHLEVWFSLYRYAAAVLMLSLCLTVVGKAHAYINRICWENKTQKAKHRCMFLAATRLLLFLLNKLTECNQRSLICCGMLLCGKDLHEKS